MQDIVNPDICRLN